MSLLDLEEVVEYGFNESCVFNKVKDEYGGLSNMSNDFRVRVNGVLIKNTEALYQACRFPDWLEVQKVILKQASGMTAKMKSKHYRNNTRKDWEDIRVEVMRWCIRVKLAQNPVGFKNLLLSTGDREIVEKSHKDKFWGAVLVKKRNVLVGKNVLGKLLMEAREVCRLADEQYRYVVPPAIENFMLLDEVVRPVGRRIIVKV